MTRWEVVSATAHRAMPEGSETWVRGRLFRCAEWLREERGTLVGISGMARGGDLWWADAVVRAGLTLRAYLPFVEQTRPWSVADRREWERLLALAEQPPRIVGVLPDLPPKGRSAAVNRLLHARNSAMREDSDAIVAVWDGRLDGGTHGALVAAARRRPPMPGVHLDPAARSRPTFHLPGLDQLLKHVVYHRGCGCVAATGVRAEVEAIRAALHAAGHSEWRIRSARPRETTGAGCRVCSTDPERIHAAFGRAAGR